MKQKRPVIKRSRDIEDLHHLRLMTLLREVVRDYGYKGAARVLGVDPQTVTSSAKSGQLTHRVRDRLEWALQYGVGSAADEQRERNDKLEKRLDKMEDQLKDLKENLRSGLKELKMSLDGVRKYYTEQRRLVEQRLLILEGALRIRRPDHPQVMRMDILRREASHSRAEAHPSLKNRRGSMRRPNSSWAMATATRLLSRANRCSPGRSSSSTSRSNPKAGTRKPRLAAASL